MKKLMLAVCSLVATSAISPVLAQDSNSGGPQGAGDNSHGGRGGWHRGGRGRDGMIREMLTPAQQKQFDQIMQDSRQSGEPLFQKLETLKGQQGAKPDPALDAKIADAQKAVAAHRKATHEKIQALLTPDQKAAMEKRRAERRAAMEGGGGNAGGRGPAASPNDPDKD